MMIIRMKQITAEENNTEIETRECENYTHTHKKKKTQQLYKYDLKINLNYYS